MEEWREEEHEAYWSAAPGSVRGLFQRNEVEIDRAGHSVTMLHSAHLHTNTY